LATRKTGLTPSGRESAQIRQARISASNFARDSFRVIADDEHEQGTGSKGAVDGMRGRPHGLAMRISVTLGIAGALAFTVEANAVENRPLCDFVQKVLAAKADSFMALRGEARNPAVFHNEVFTGTLLPASGSECTLFIRSKAGSAELPAKYSCTLGSAKTLDAANRVFARDAQDLRACYPKAQFNVMYDGDGKDPADSLDWIVSTDVPGFSLELEMSNGMDLIAQSFGGGSGNPELAITLDVTEN